MKLNGAALLAALLALASIVLPVGLGNGAPVHWHDLSMPLVAVGLCLLAALATLRRHGNNSIVGIVALGGALVGASAPRSAPRHRDSGSSSPASRRWPGAGSKAWRTCGHRAGPAR